VQLVNTGKIIQDLTIVWEKGRTIWMQDSAIKDSFSYYPSKPLVHE